MKKLLSILFILAWVSCFSQTNYLLISERDCGIPIYYSDTTKWETIDTLNKHINPSVLKDVTEHRYDSDWVYSEIIGQPKSMITTAEYNPCKTYINYYDQYRVCKITGIRQHRIITTGFKYASRPVSEYQKTVENFNKN